METVTLFLIVAILYIGQSSRPAAAQAPYTLVDSRAVGSNVITLRCRNSNDDFDSQAMYFLNGTRLDSLDGFQDTDEDPGRVVFQINRRLEGEYSCGAQLQRSPSLSFVAFPDSSPILPSDPVIVLVGETARLQCGIQPGALVGQYFARWFNGTSGRTLYNYPAPSQRLADPSLEMSDSPRYNIDPSDLSLMISNVQRNDSFENYHCEVGVEDPRSPSRTTYFYELTRSHRIILEVVAPPQIIRDFRPNTILAEEQRIQFKCIARGYPAPTISWEHEGQMVVNSDNPHLNVNSTNNRNDGFIVTVTSFLTVSSADDSVSGEVRCIALPPPPDMVGGMALNSDDTSTQLSILGSFNELEIEITTRGDVIVIVDLPRALPIPVHLVLVYRDIDNPSTAQDIKITQAAYLNTSAIRHIDFASQVPFEHFTAEVGLFSENVHGPLNGAQGEFDTDKPTIFDTTVPTVTLVIIGAVPAIIILIIAATTTIIIGQIYRDKHRKHKLEYKKQLSDNSHREEEQRNQQNHEEKEHEIDVNKEVQMRKLELQHDENIQCRQIDKNHEYKLECLKTFKELLLEDPNRTIENLKELLKFLNVDIVPLLDFSNRKRNPQVNTIPPDSQMEYATNGVNKADGPAVVEETDFGPAPSLTNGTMVTDALDADEREVMELLGSFIKSAQASLQQQHMGIPI